MSEEIMAADANLAEIARLRSELSDARQALAQARQATESERVARRNAEADNAALIGALDDLLHEVRHTLAGRSTRPDLVDAEQDALARSAKPHPGRALLTELDAARAVVAHARDWREAFEQLDGVYDAEQALIGALRQHDAAVKARDT